MSVEIKHGIKLVERRGALAIVEDASGRELPLSSRMVAATFDRYGKQIDVPVPARTDEDQAVAFALPTGGRATLRAFSFKAWGDVIPSHWLLLERAGAEPLAAPAPLAAAALLALGAAAAAATPRPEPA